MCCALQTDTTPLFSFFYCVTVSTAGGHFGVSQNLGLDFGTLLPYDDASTGKVIELMLLLTDT
jgi:hypothetical protein